MRIEQPRGNRGSLKWIQRAVAEHWPPLEKPILAATGDAALRWHSPLAADAFAEYRDEGFLALLGQLHLADALHAFWPARGPQWDALGKTASGGILLVEAKAHVAELMSPATAAGAASRQRIEAVFEDLAGRLRASPLRAPWTGHFYQLANRLAHLDFMRRNGVDAWLVLVDFIGDDDMGGPHSPEAWDAAYQVAHGVMGLSTRHPLSRHIIHVRPDVRDFP